MSRKTNHIRYRMCERKIRYPDYNSAMKAAKKILERTGDKLYPYDCRYCNGWHLSHEVWDDAKSWINEEE